MAELSLTEYAVLGLLAERPGHGFAISKELGPDGGLGRILTVRRPLVYRALDRLVDIGLAETMHVEPGDSGPDRIIHRVTRKGRARLRRWLTVPVLHVREIRIEFLLKLTLITRAGRSPAELIEHQRAALQTTLDALDDSAPDDPVEIWRKHNARAANDYLAELAELYG